MSDIKLLFPYGCDEKVVTEDMCDINGHMNVAYYLEAYDVYSRALFEEIGYNKEYFKAGFSCFAVEDSLRYLKEFLLGEEIFPRFRIHDYNKKLIHVVGVLLDSNNQLSSISETIVAHVNMNTRRTLDMPKALIQQVQKFNHDHTQEGDLDFDLRLKITK